MNKKVIIGIVVLIVFVIIGVVVGMTLTSGSAVTTPIPTPTIPIPTPSDIVVPPIPTPVVTAENIKVPLTCEENAVVIVCPTGKKIKSGTIRYGRWNNTVCPHQSVRENTPVISNNYPLPSSWIGQNTINFDGYMRDAVGQDPYPNVFKTYEIDIVCDL